MNWSNVIFALFVFDVLIIDLMDFAFEMQNV